jgi:hypothetical protein
MGVRKVGEVWSKKDVYEYTSDFQPTFQQKKDKARKDRQKAWAIRHSAIVSFMIRNIIFALLGIFVGWFFYVFNVWYFWDRYRPRRIFDKKDFMSFKEYFDYHNKKRKRK